MNELNAPKPSSPATGSEMAAILSSAQDLLQYVAANLADKVHERSPIMQSVVAADARIEAVRVWLKSQNDQAQTRR